VVAVAKRFERRPIESRVGTFPDVFSSMNSRLKAWRVEVNQGSDLDLRLENLVITGACLSSRKDRSGMVLYSEYDNCGRLGYKDVTLKSFYRNKR